jgi:hypothetical protein
MLLTCYLHRQVFRFNPPPPYAALNNSGMKEREFEPTDCALIFFLNVRSTNASNCKLA